MGPLGDVVIHRHCRVVGEQRQPRPVLAHAHKHLGRRLAQRGLAQRLAAPLGHVEQGLSQRTVVLVEVGTALGLCKANSIEPIQLRDGVDPGQRPGQHRRMGVAKFEEVSALVALQAALARRASPS